MTILDIFVNTPKWVLILFIFLVARGIKATKNSDIPVERIFIIPTIFTILTGLSISKYLDKNLLNTNVLIASSIIFIFIGWVSVNQSKLKYDKLNRYLEIPGSLNTLIFILIIFPTRFYVGYNIATTTNITNNLINIISISCGLSGIFIGRLIAYINHVIKSYK